MNEQDILKLISENKQDLKEARLVLSELKQKIIDAETKLIGLKLKSAQLKETLTKYRNEHDFEDCYDRD